MKKFALVVCLLSLASPLLAQQGQSGVNGLSFVAPFRISVGNDSNFIVDRTNPNERLFILSLPPSIQPGAPDVRPKLLDDQVLNVTLPKVAFQNDSRRHELSFTYAPEVELYRVNHDQNSWSHEATANFMYYLTRRVQVSVGDTYRTSKDPARTMQNVFLLLPRSRFQDNALRAAIDFQTSAVMGFRLRYDATRSTFGQTDPFQARILDSTSSGLSFVVTRMLAPNHRLRVTYSAFKVKPINRVRTNDDAVDASRSFEKPVHGVAAEYRLRWNPSTILEFSGGGTRLDTGFSYTYQVTADKRYGDFWIGAGFARSLSYSAGSPTAFANGLSATGFYNSLLVRLKGQATRNIGLQIEARAAQDGAGRFAQSTRSLMGIARLDYRLSDRTVAFTSLQTFQQNSNDYVRTPIARNRFMVGIEFSLANERDRRMNDLNQDEQYVALTDHIKRRQPE